VSSPPSDRAVLMVGDMPKPFGGVGIYCYQVCTELSQRGVAVHFADSEPSNEKILPPLASYQQVTGRYGRGTLEALGSPAVLRCWAALTGPIATDIGPRVGLQVLVIASRVHSVAQRERPERILAHHAGVRGLAAAVAGRTLGIPVTLIVHGAEWASPKWNRRLAAVVAQRADRVIANSDYTRQLCRSGSGRADIEVAFPGVDHKRFRPDPDRAQLRDDQPVVLFVGAMHRRKGADVLARAIPLLGDLPARFRFAGPTGSLEEEVRSIVAGAGAEAQVEFLGELSFDELARTVADADVLVFPTVWGTEGFGMIAAEAMACGVPVVGSRIGAIPEVVLDGRTGLLFEPGEAGDLASRLRLLLEDPQLRRRLGALAAEHAARYRWDRLADALVGEEPAPLGVSPGC
jgi:glycosyltransferase involved in cell wall biosynthesis